MRFALYFLIWWLAEEVTLSSGNCMFMQFSYE